MSGGLVVAEARRWIGTPYRHQASIQGAGTDCLGLVRGVWRALLGPEPEVLPAYTLDWSEPQAEERLWAAALRNLVPLETGEPQVGEVILFRMRQGSVAKHLGIVTRGAPNGAFVHAYTRHGVVETSLSRPWQRRVVARFAFPLED